MYARTTPAVFSGRSVRLCALSLSARARSSHVYISLETISVSSPTLRANSAVSSKIGVRISPNPYRANTARAVASTRFQRTVSGGSRSLVPRTAFKMPIMISVAKIAPDLGAGSIPQVNGCVVQVVLGVLENECAVFVAQRASNLPRNAGDQRVPRNYRLLRNACTSRNDATLPDPCIIQDRPAEAHQT